MGDAEIINELKRLSDVVAQLEGSNVNLVSMLAELQASNVNLASVITELEGSATSLTAMIAQQIITNTNLVANVARLTTITGQLVTVNIRALDDTDIPHQGLPYNYVPITIPQVGIVANNTIRGITFTSADWGVGLNFYAKSVAIEFRMPDTVYWKWWHSLGLFIYEDNDPVFPVLLQQTMNTRTYPPSWNSDTNEKSLRVTFPLKLNLVDSDSSLVVIWLNRTGGNIDASEVRITVIGVVL